MYSPVPVTMVRHRSDFKKSDVITLVLVGVFIYLLVTTAAEWKGVLRPAIQIDLGIGNLPYYSALSLARAVIAYILSLLFTLVFGYAAAKNRAAERIIVPLLDIGQSIPVLGFLPGLVLGLMALFPRTNTGLELACILLIFTGQVWNMTFSFISSLKSVPIHFHEMSDNVGFSRLRKLFRIELPCAATGLAWNSLMSMAGGWFFLTVCESFTLGEKNFRLPGLGSYMAVAIEQDSRQAMIYGVLSMIAVILFTDFVIWRPIIAWTARFRISEGPEDFQNIPFMTMLFRESRIAHLFSRVAGLFLDFGIRFYQRSSPSSRKRPPEFPETILNQRTRALSWASRLRSGMWQGAFGLLLLYFSIKLLHFVDPVRWVDWRDILIGAGFTFLRVVAALLIATLWAVPAGIWIGLSPKVTRFFQPIIQVAASFPAPMLYPLALLVFGIFGLPIGISAALLMLLGVQWYILFNVLAGAISISQDLIDSFRLMGVSKRYLWTRLYLPSVFPSLVTGWVTAAGGAWNASIVSEFVTMNGKTLLARGLGSRISQATSQGDYPILAACLIVMIISVVALNRLVWSRCYRLAEVRFRFER